MPQTYMSLATREAVASAQAKTWRIVAVLGWLTAAAVFLTR